MPAYLDEQALFSEAMRKKLRDRSGRSLNYVTVGYCLERCAGELIELAQAVARGRSFEEIMAEAADVANFAMFVAIKHGAIKK